MDKNNILHRLHKGEFTGLIDLLIIFNKEVHDQGRFVSFTVWADAVSQMDSFIDKAVHINGLPKTLKYQHDTSMGFWVDFNVPVNILGRVIREIKKFNDKFTVIHII